jgi:hypothetical protein
VGYSVLLRREDYCSKELLGTVLLGVMLCRFFSMVRSVQMVTMCDVGMMARLFMATARVVLGRFFMMAGRMFMMFGRFCVVFCTLLAHRGWG